MEHILVTLLSQLTEVSESEAEEVENTFPLKTFKKGTYLLKEGQVANDSYFVVQGCIRNYEILGGAERTIDFYTEHQSASNLNSLTTGNPSTINLVCTEDTTVAIFNPAKEKILYNKFPRFKALCMDGMEEIMSVQQQKIWAFHKMSPEERYQNLQTERPDLLNRVPQYQLASYLGIKPESLSRIRKRLSAKN